MHGRTLAVEKPNKRLSRFRVVGAARRRRVGVPLSREGSGGYVVAVSVAQADEQRSHAAATLAIGGARQHLTRPRAANRCSYVIRA
jgi:hypothetical protein